MDKITRQLVEYTTGFSEGALSAGARSQAQNILFDTIACAVAGTASEPAAIVSRLASRVRCDPSATVIGSGLRTSPELAALANAMMVRTYDYNDAFYGHPSDMIPGILAAAQVAGAPGREVIAAIVLCYEVFAGFARSGPYHLDNWMDQGVFMNVAVALAAGKILGLDGEQLANASSLALVPNLPLGVSRWGALSMMKGCTTAFSVRNGLFAAMLAKEGFTSAPEPYEGTFGLFSAVGSFDLKLPISTELNVVEMAYIKPIPAENNTIGLLELTPEIRAFAPADQIDRIEIDIATGLDHHLADEPKYDPKTRESADHSLPFMLARALVDGEITLDTYRQDRILDPALRPLMRKIEVRADAGMKEIMRASEYTEAKPARIRVTAGDRVFERDVMNHSGHPQTPPEMRRQMLDRKLGICAGHAGLSDEARDRIRDAWWRIGEAPDLEAAFASLSGIRKPGAAG